MSAVTEQSNIAIAEDREKAELIKQIESMFRGRRGAREHYERCRVAANELAADVYAYLEDPDGVGTDDLRAAWQRFSQKDAGNFG